MRWVFSVRHARLAVKQSSMSPVNDAVTIDPERALALGYAPASARAALVTLFALDARLRRIALVARDPMIGMMRLTWWSDALERLDASLPPAEPLLQALARAVLPVGVTGAALAGLVDGWLRLLEGDSDLSAFAAERGGRLFALAAVLLGSADARVERVGEGWALVDLGAGWPSLAAQARLLARPALAGAFATPWPRRLRPLGALGLLARSDLDAIGRPGSPRRVARLLAHRLTGR